MLQFYQDTMLGTVPTDAMVFPQWMGIPMSCIILSAIAWAYKGHGVLGVSCLMGYITSLIVVTLTMKQLMGAFPYPLFLSCTHFVSSLMAVLALIKVTGEETSTHNFECKDFRKWYLTKIVPPVTCVYLSVVLNNASLMYIGAGLNGMISLATPVITALMASMFGMKIAALGWIGIFLCVTGDAVITVQGFHVSIAEGQSIDLFIWGLVLSILALMIRGAKTVLLDKLMNSYGEEEKKLTPLGTWYFQGPLLACFGISGTLLKEGLQPWQALPTLLGSPVSYIVPINIFAAVSLNVLAMYVIKMLGAPASQIAGKFNVLVVAALSCAFLGETLTLQQGGAAMLILTGATVFEKAQEKKIDSLQSLMVALKGEKYGATP